MTRKSLQPLQPGCIVLSPNARSPHPQFLALTSQTSSGLNGTFQDVNRQLNWVNGDLPTIAAMNNATGLPAEEEQGYSQVDRPRRAAGSVRRGA